MSDYSEAEKMRPDVPEKRADAADVIFLISGLTLLLCVYFSDSS